MDFFNSIAKIIENNIIKKVFRYTLMLLFYSIVAAIVLNTFLLSWGFDAGMEGYRFEKMITFNSLKTYAMRVLTPAVINILSEISPEFLKKKLLSLPAKGIQKTQFEKMKYRYQLGDGFEIEKLITYMYLYGSIFAVLLLLRFLTKMVYDPPSLWLDFGPAIGLLFYPLTFINGGYIFDFTEMLFLLFSIILLIKSKIFFYYLVFILAIINKFTAGLLIFYFFALNYKRMTNHEILKHLILQILITAMIYQLLSIRFNMNPEGIYSWGRLEFFSNIKEYLNPTSYLSFNTVYSILVPSPKSFNIINIFLFLFLTFFRWSEKSILIKRLFLVSVAFNFPIFVIFCYKHEIRNLSFIFPAFYLLAFQTIVSFYDTTSLQTKRFSTPRVDIINRE